MLLKSINPKRAAGLAHDDTGHAAPRKSGDTSAASPAGRYFRRWCVSPRARDALL
jgi:hypothetical protein